MQSQVGASRCVGRWAVVAALVLVAVHDGKVAAQQEAADTAPAPAQPEVVVEEIYASMAVSARNPGSKMNDSLALPSGALELGVELALLTSSARVAGEPLAFTDAGLLRLRARKSFGAQLELFAGTQLLAKRPDASDAELWQGVQAGAQWLFAPDLGISVQASAGPVLDSGDGYFSAGPTLSSKHRIDYHVHFELGVGYLFTALDLEAPDDPLFHLHEAHAYAEVQLGNHSGGMFTRFAYHLPFASGPSAQHSPERYLDPSAQLNVQIGAVLVAGDQADWDIYAVCTIVDRGNADDPATILPILDGGFDQQQWTAAVQHRF